MRVWSCGLLTLGMEGQSWNVWSQMVVDLHAMPRTAQLVSQDGRPIGHIDAQVGSIPRV
jgi:hypothetical protein